MKLETAVQIGKDRLPVYRLYLKATDPDVFPQLGYFCRLSRMTHKYLERGHTVPAYMENAKVYKSYADAKREMKRLNNILMYYEVIEIQESSR